LLMASIASRLRLELDISLPLPHSRLRPARRLVRPSRPQFSCVVTPPSRTPMRGRHRRIHNAHRVPKQAVRSALPPQTVGRGPQAVRSQPMTAGFCRGVAILATRSTSAANGQGARRRQDDLRGRDAHATIRPSPSGGWKGHPGPRGPLCRPHRSGPVRWLLPATPWPRHRRPYGQAAYPCPGGPRRSAD